MISIDSADHDPFVSMIAARASGDISIVASTDAKSVGLEAGSFDLELTDNGLKVISSNAEAADVNLDVQGLPGQVLSMTICQKRTSLSFSIVQGQDGWVLNIRCQIFLRNQISQENTALK